jgi:hypothetical protein
MKDTLTSLNHQDFKARYVNTFGWLLKDDGTRELVHVENSNEDRVYFNAGGGKSYHANVDAGVHFEFIPVNRGWFNATDGNVYYLQRQPARQWKRGICDSNTAMWSITNMNAPLKVTLAKLQTIFVEGWNNWQIKNISQIPYAISRAFAISPTQLVYFYNQPVGTYSNGVISLDDTSIYQELSDTIRRRYLGIKVEIHD